MWVRQHLATIDTYFMVSCTDPGVEHLREAAEHAQRSDVQPRQPAAELPRTVACSDG
jgi:homoaconitase/3-isopropylmalate dehydratase large subunit